MKATDQIINESLITLKRALEQADDALFDLKECGVIVENPTAALDSCREWTVETLQQMENVKAAWEWVNAHKDEEQSALCPICGEITTVRTDIVTENGRLIGTCGDAFGVESWEESW